MLIEKKWEPKQNEVMTMRLKDGAEVVCRFKEMTDSGQYKILKPMTFIMGPQGPGLIPFLLSMDRDSELCISLSDVLCIVKTEDGVGKQYIQLTTNVLLPGAIS